MDEDDRWKQGEVFTQGMPRMDLAAYCSFPNFLMFLCSYEWLKVHRKANQMMYVSSS